MADNPSKLADQLLKKKPWKLDAKKYPDVEKTPYGYIYNVGNRSITDVGEQMKRIAPKKYNKDYDYGFTLFDDGEEIYYPSFDEAYKAAKGGK